MIRHAAALGDGGGSADIFNAAIGAGTNENHIHLQIGQALAGGQAHIVNHALQLRALGFIALICRVRHNAGDGQHRLGIGAPGHLRRNLMRSQAQFLVEMGTRVRWQRLPPFQRALESLTLRAIRRFRDVIEGGLVRRHHASAGTAFDGHVADRHAACHVERPDRIPGIFSHMARAARRADLADDRQHNILAGTAKSQIAIHGNTHVLGGLLQQRLRRQHMFHF